jgi:ABC-2 type transport system permease protein
MSSTFETKTGVGAARVQSMRGHIQQWVGGIALVYRAYFRMSIALNLQYRMAMIIWLIGMIVEPLMYLVVWRTVAIYNGGNVSGYSAGDFSAYFIATMLVNHVTFSWIMWEYDYRIRMGEFSTTLLKPIHPIHKDIAENLGYKLLTLLIILPTAALLAWLFRPTFSFTAGGMMAFVPGVTLAFFMRFLLEWTLAMAAFWTTRISAINQAYFVLLLFFSGRLAPLDLFPGFVQTIADLLPFRWMISFPVQLVLGQLSVEETIVGFIAQLIWLVIGYGLIRVVYRAGIKRYAAFGS